MSAFLLGLVERLGATEIHETQDGIEARCPFSGCPGKRRSFRVRTYGTNYGRWICHACEAHGDTIRLIQLALVVPFKEAQRIAKEEGEIDRLARPRAIEAPKLGLEHVEPFRPVLSSYLVHRGYRPEDVWHYRIGYDEHAREIVAPTYDPKGTLVGISRRAPFPGSPFIHSPFPNKSSHVFGIDLAIAHGSTACVVTEGQLDPLGLRPYWTDDPIVSSLGSYLSDTQAEMLAAYFEHVIVAYDNDKAGAKGTLRAFQALRAQGLTSLYVMTYNAEDPGALPLADEPIHFGLVTPVQWMAQNASLLHQIKHDQASSQTRSQTSSKPKAQAFHHGIQRRSHR